MNLQEGFTQWAEHSPHFEAQGVILPGVRSYITSPARQSYKVAMDAAMGYDALPAMSLDPSAGLPALFTTYVDPDTIEILFAPNKCAKILGEQKKGDWTTDTAMFPIVEADGEVSSYGDYSTAGLSDANANFPQRQAYAYQTIIRYGDLESARYGEAKLNWVTEKQNSASNTLMKFQNYAYFFGVQGLANYGLLNDPGLSASITPATKAAGGTKWILNGVYNATANEVYADIQALFAKVVAQTAGLVDADSPMVLALDPTSATALQITNSFNVNVKTLLAENFKNLRIETAVQYGVTSATNFNGIAAGNLVQLIVDSVEGQDTGFCGFAEKARAFPIIRQHSSYEQKWMGKVWGSVIRMPMAIASMIGV